MHVPGSPMNDYKPQSAWLRSDAPMEPVGPSDSVGPSDPVGPPDPVSPSAPTKPSIPALPLEPSVPVKPTTPLPVIPAVPMEPAKPIAPVIPSVPMQPAKPIAPVIPAVPTQPAKPIFPGVVLPIHPQPRYANVRFLHAAFGYPPFRILINNSRAVNWLGYTSLSGYCQVRTGYQTITVTSAEDGYVYIQKSFPFQVGHPSTIAVINTPDGGLDLLQIPDNCCPPSGNFSNLRISNLAMNSGPMDVLLADGRVVFADVRFKETTAYKRIRPGAYQFFFAETSLTPMPRWMDIETQESGFTGSYPVPNTMASLYLNAVGNTNYTIFLLNSGRGDAVQAILTESK